jgi:hypothetical protein
VWTKLADLAGRSYVQFAAPSIAANAVTVGIMTSDAIDAYRSVMADPNLTSEQRRATLIRILGHFAFVGTLTVMQLKGDLAAIKGHAPIEIAEAGGHPVVVREGTRIPSGGTPHATGVKTQGKSVDKATELAAKTQHARELRAKADNASTHASDTKQEVAKPDSGVANQRSASTQAPDTKQDTPGNSGAVVGNESESSTKSPSKKPKLSAEKIAELQARAEARKKTASVSWTTSSALPSVLTARWARSRSRVPR